jgi:hypothetical protein
MDSYKIVIKNVIIFRKILNQKECVMEDNPKSTNTSPFSVYACGRF